MKIRKLIVILSIMLSILCSAKENVFSIKVEDIKTNKLITIKELAKNKKILIRAWASWCPYCIKSLGDFEILSSKKNLGYEVISVVCPTYNGELSKRDFLENWKFDYEDKYPNQKIYYVNKEDFTKILSIRAYPTYIYVDSNGYIQKQITGVSKNYLINRNMKEIK